MKVEVGDRIELVSTNDEYTLLKPGDQGVVTRYDNGPGIRLMAGGPQISVRWDNGSTLSLLPSAGDRFSVVNGKEPDGDQ
jgi:hypothetical protein